MFNICMTKQISREYTCKLRYCSIELIRKKLVTNLKLRKSLPKLTHPEAQNYTKISWKCLPNTKAYRDPSFTFYMNASKYQTEMGKKPSFNY